jgi:hypothetical protein
MIYIYWLVHGYIIDEGKASHCPIQLKHKRIHNYCKIYIIVVKKITNDYFLICSYLHFCNGSIHP